MPSRTNTKKQPRITRITRMKEPKEVCWIAFDSCHSCDSWFPSCLSLWLLVRDKRSIKIPIPEDAPQRGEGVLEADLLAFLVGAPGVTDRHFVDAPGWPAPAGDLGGELRLEAEAVRLQLDPFEHLTP